MAISDTKNVSNCNGSTELERVGTSDNAVANLRLTYQCCSLHKILCTTFERCAKPPSTLKSIQGRKNGILQ
eukprot:scaffold2930_cov198-Alexandrium_tamarense.AAC.4